MTAEAAVAGYLPAPPKPRPAHYLLAVGLALGGGVFGVLAAVFGELRAGGSVLLIFAGAPIIEEIAKPAGVYVLLWRWRRLAWSRPALAALAALAGLSFGLIESTMYVTVYSLEDSQSYVLFRYTVPVFLHGLASFTAGWGIHERLIGWAEGKNPLPKSSRNAFIAAMAMHAVYNTVAVALAFAGVLDFD